MSIYTVICVTYLSTQNLNSWQVPCMGPFKSPVRTYIVAFLDLQVIHSYVNVLPLYCMYY